MLEMIFAPIIEAITALLLWIFGPVIALGRAIVAAVIGMVIHLLATLFSSGWLVARRKGAVRWINLLIVLMTGYLLLVLARGFVPALARPSLAFLFPGWAVLLALCVLFMLVVFSGAVQDLAQEAASASTVMLVSYLLAAGLLVGALSLWSHTERAPRMEERYCDRLAARISTGLAEDAGRVARWLAEKRGKPTGDLTACLEHRAAQEAKGD